MTGCAVPLVFTRNWYEVRNLWLSYLVDRPALREALTSRMA
jgi:hypothetical protein